jgi:hypothetical protein
MGETFCHALWRDQPTTTIWAEAVTGTLSRGEVRAAISRRFTSSAEPNARIFGSSGRPRRLALKASPTLHDSTSA